MLLPTSDYRPETKIAPFLKANWHYLVMLNYDITPELLTPFVPAGTTLDIWNGRAIVSVVGFRFLQTRVRGLAVPFHRNFDEINLRLYVRHTTPDGEERHGVTFIRELVPRRAIAAVARLMYNEPYRSVRMRSSTPAAIVSQPGRLTYEFQIGGRWCTLAATATGEVSAPAADSEALFITEHRWGYTRQRDGGTVEYEVVHPRWRVWNATAPALDADIESLYGPQFAPALTAAPSSAYIAEGSEVAVYSPRRL
jgi:uncharacterized protein YqjF (DUF2071 family)